MPPQKRPRPLTKNENVAPGRPAGGRPAKKVKASHDAPRSRAPEARPQTNGKASENVELNGPSLLSKEESAFPRGGASVLTPLEHKQIKIEATRDVLFEQAGTGTKAYDPDDDTADEAAEAVPTRDKKRKPTVKKKPDVFKSEAAEDLVRIEGLGFKRVIPGSIILGQISQINRYDMALTLPNNLTGYIPITAISDQLTAQIESLASAMDRDDGSEASSPQEDVSLKDIFAIGQYLRACVTATGAESSNNGQTKGKRRIELSISPRHANGGLTKSDLVTHSMIQASVASVEDHGLIMDLGLADDSVKGFVPSSELGAEAKLDERLLGAVLLCLVTGRSSNGKTIKLSADMQKAGDVRKSRLLTKAPTVDAILPGSAVEILLATVTPMGVSGKVMGMLDVTADVFHCGVTVEGRQIQEMLKPGQKVKGRVICTFPTAESKKLGVSLLDHILSLISIAAVTEGKESDPLSALPLSTIVEDATVAKILGSTGLLLQLGVKGLLGFVHISAVSDKRIDTLFEATGSFKIGSKHRARITGYNSVDGLYIASMQDHILKQPFLRFEDVAVGEVVQGTVEKLIINEGGNACVLVNLADGITGLVSEMHLADIKLSYPEKRFKEGMHITARVLSANPERRRLRLTLKKTLVNSDLPVITSYENISSGVRSSGTIINIIPSGAFVQFFGPVRAYLPISEMSESLIEDPTTHFRIGQTVNVRVVSVDPDAEKMLVSCKDPIVFGSDQQLALHGLKVGSLVNGTVTEKASNEVRLQLEGSQLSAILHVGHLSDGSDRRNERAMKEIRIGQSFRDLVVWDKKEARGLIVLTNKPTLRSAAASGQLVTTFTNLEKGMVVHGTVKNIIPTGVFIQLGGGLTGLVLKRHLTDEAMGLPVFGLRPFQSVSATVQSVDHDQQRFFLTMRESGPKEAKSAGTGDGLNLGIVNPVDPSVTSHDDLSVGRITKGRIKSVKNTQINVQLADNVQARVDVTEAFDSWDAIEDRKRPLHKFRAKDVISVRILGLRDARNHRFLPITHRAGKNPVFELSAKPSTQTDREYNALTLDKVTVGSSWMAFVNNIKGDYVWASLSPNVRGRIRLLELSDDVSLLKDLEKHFPVGSALRVCATKVNVEENRLDLSALSVQSAPAITFDSLSTGMVIPGRITKIAERYLLVQLSESVAGTAGLTDLADDYDQVNLFAFSKNEVVRVCITALDAAKGRVHLSLRPSKSLNSALPVKDPEIRSISQLKVNAIVRGFVRNVAEIGLFVSLGTNVTACVKVSDLSDAYIEDWKAPFQVDQIVRGKIIAVDPLLNHVQMSLKESVLAKHYVPPITFNDLQVGQMITGKVRKVETFGVFIVADNSTNVSGLCHRSEIADQKVGDVSKLYQEGDVVKAKVLHIHPEKRRISLGLKASYFTDVQAENDTASDGGVQLEDRTIDDVEDGVNGVEREDSDVESAHEDDQEVYEDGKDGLVSGKAPGSEQGLQTSGFDWSAGTLDAGIEHDAGPGSDLDERTTKASKKRRRRAEIRVDRTGELDAHGPQSAADFERLLLGEPESSYLWLQYMAHQIQVGEVEQARAVAERALRTISMTEESEKLNVWVGLLNLENAYGTEDGVAAVLARACQSNEPQDVHERLISIYIASGKLDAADDLFQAGLRGRKFSQSPAFWLNYATFLMTSRQAADRARALLARATHALPPHLHLDLTSKFAQLEFRSPHGDPERGRTLFEGLLTTWPRRVDLWHILLDMELRRAELDRVRALFHRLLGARPEMTTAAAAAAAPEAGRGTPKLKARQARWFFKRWLQFEEDHAADDADGRARVERVKRRAAVYVDERKRDVADADADDRRAVGIRAAAGAGAGAGDGDGNTERDA
ncbi:MAG: rRNA biogenesis protein rrp5 [Phylliscum demangeonii]|nr:MAG: rRNA biogenesis protein rrp5 [Phylliscum demangeonii]